MSSPDGQDLSGLARDLARVVSLAHEKLDMTDEAPTELVVRVTEHLGCEISGIVAVQERFAIWDHVNFQRGVDAYLAARGDEPAWFGVSAGMTRPHQDLLSRMAEPMHRAMGRVGNAAYETAPTGPDSETEVVARGLVESFAPDGVPVVIGIRAERDFGQPHGVLEILSPQRAAAMATRAEIARLADEHNIFRGQVLSFGQSEHHGNELVSFLPRTTLEADDVVLPDGVLEAIEEHVVGPGSFASELRAAGQHLKRGLLLHGAPGTGKTHTVRYLAGRLTGTTVIMLTGQSIRFVEEAAALARRLQPSMVVLEDVDLVATDRSISPFSNPLLFTLLDAMDGVGADADVTFVLTTNRADVLERALADRPGRIDLAIEVPRPDADCRERLISRYARDVAVEADLAGLVAATEGVTASLVKELIRRAVLASLRAGDRPAVITQEHADAVLAEMGTEHQALTRALLGGPGSGASGAEPAPDEPAPAPWAVAARPLPTGAPLAARRTIRG